MFIFFDPEFVQSIAFRRLQSVFCSNKLVAVFKFSQNGPKVSCRRIWK